MRNSPTLVRLFALLSVVAVLFAGCGKKRASTLYEDSYPLPDDPKVVDVTGSYGGRVIAATISGPKTFNVITANETSSTEITNRMFEGLTSFNNYLQKVEPGLASSWEASPDYRVWTFHLRKGLRWSDGARLTVDDVLFSFQIAYDPTIHPSIAELLQVNRKPFKVDEIDSLTIRLTLDAPYGPLLSVIGALPILPKHKLEQAFKNKTFESTWGNETPPSEIVCSGPFMLKEYLPNEKVVLKRNPHFWAVDRDGRRLPYLDELVYVIVPDLNALLLKFQSGEIDLHDSVRPEDYAVLKSLEKKGNFAMYSLGLDIGTSHLWFNLNGGRNARNGKAYVDPVKFKWFSNENFRRAVAHAIDREGIAKTVYFGMGEPIWGPTSPADKVWYNPDVKKYPYDLAKAREILRQEGFIDRDRDGYIEDKDGHTVEFTLLTNTGNNPRNQIGNLIKEDLTKLGMKVIFSPIEFNSLIVKINETYDYDAVLLGLTSGVPNDPILGMNVFLSSGRTHNWYPEQPRPATRWEAVIDSLMNAQIGLTQFSQRKAVYDQVQAIMSDHVPFIYTVNPMIFCAVRNKFGNLQPSILRERVLWNAHTIFQRPETISGK
ncbi:MAG: ABC transporter substrate-binding protein [Candidatus Eisenbacteria bacterium]|nr:ABC transporter substrate-binding protein [Candidatus Eisenbacteria bacterium]